MLLDFFIAPAYAQQEPGTGDLVFFLVFTALLIAIFYFLLIRPQRKRMKEHQEMVEGLQVGDEVVTAGGELGRITRVSDDFVRLEVAQGVEWSIKREMVGEVLPQGTLDKARSGDDSRETETEQQS
ncbi:preprotein translocase subunit YajC [Halorhodospira halochloris]|uniref:Sec translocon accessory complex subunit YajC n=1 Tax=Halorhodospira halochloris TaxID=1052 RepID=A0A0X8XCK8_HALHR|nr:preprotein translocase subunit YajC [Halorhodospira halochloris]MBK1652603.1 preprotein translocase subunit YajC [Halorhodospira halochloris]MCG5548634.1 preprotein translocase subunit YajC [Halorhodospira halochloris]BAU58194.1 preprotein translocase subunit YajC [Halorhodospira halochloris]